jgi:hypothetical protein
MRKEHAPRVAIIPTRTRPRALQWMSVTHARSTPSRRHRVWWLSTVLAKRATLARTEPRALVVVQGHTRRRLGMAGVFLAVSVLSQPRSLRRRQTCAQAARATPPPAWGVTALWTARVIPDTTIRICIALCSRNFFESIHDTHHIKFGILKRPSSIEI